MQTIGELIEVRTKQLQKEADESLRLWAEARYIMDQLKPLMESAETTTEEALRKFSEFSSVERARHLELTWKRTMWRMRSELRDHNDERRSVVLETLHRLKGKPVEDFIDDHFARAARIAPEAMPASSRR